ncbi:hypothetical protein ACFX2G_041228 [Malus domestica]
MSFNQSTSDKNETQYRKTGRSASSNQQHRGYSPAYPKGTGATVSVTNVSPQVSGMAPAQRGGVQNGAHAQPQLHAPGTASNGVSIQVGMSMPMPFHQPQVPVQFGGPNQQIQYQSMSTSSIQMPMPMQLPIRSTQVQQPVFVPGLQPHPMQPQGIMHQSQNLTFTPQMGPQIPQMGNLGISMASQCPQQQGSNFGVLRDPCAQTPVQQHVRGILPGPAHSVGHQGGMQRNNSEADRWQRATNFQPKGLMPSPHTPLQVMHQSDRKNGVGKVRDEEQAKQRQLRAILNKLTPQNFEKLFEQVKAVNIDNATTLTGVVSQIFDKALMRPTFCEMYANFCFYLAGELPDFSEDNEKITFKRLLLNKCQEEFERGEREQEEANKADEEGQVKQSEEEREEKRIKGRRRMLGNISLIGELYKKRMLTKRRMHECIKKMLGQQQTPDEGDIEALCKLMSTIGEMIDHPKAKEHMDAYFERMKSLSNNMKLSSRVRFMLKDAIDLRKNKWQQRRKVEGPKKIEEVHRDAAQELQAQSSRLARGPRINPSARRGPPMEISPRGSTMLSSPNAHMKLTPQNYEKLFEQRHQADRKNEVGKVSDEEQAKQRQLKAILNKLTPQNFEKLFEQVKAVNIDNATTLTGVISHIFDKALMEPTLCEMYANFCFYLAGELPDFSEDNEKITFKRLLLNKCQEEFERGEREQEEANKADEEGQVKQSEEEREEKRIKGRRRMLGNIRLIGELYKKRMLTERRMHECIKKMLGQQQTPDEGDIEALCKLMSTIGEMIDHPKAKEHMDAYFERMKSLSNNMKLSSRVRFMLKDAIDLRKNKWQQRSKVEGPKKIEEVHRDAAQELQAQSSRLARGPGINPSARRGPTSPRGSTMLSSPNVRSFDRTIPTSPPTRAYGAALTQNVPSENVLTEDRLRDMSLAAIREFYSARDEKEVALCIKELNSPSFHPSMISLWITDSFERKDAERDLLAKLLVNLTKTNDATLSQSQLIKGFETVLSTLEDTVIDTPRAPEFLGLIFAKVILENVVSLNQIGQLIHEGGEEPRHLLEVGLAGNILGNVLEIIKSEKGDNDLNDIRTSSNLRLETFRPPDPLKSRILEKFI